MKKEARSKIVDVDLMQSCRKNWGLGFPAISGELLGGFWQAHALRNFTAGERAVRDKAAEIVAQNLSDGELRNRLKALL